MNSCFTRPFLAPFQPCFSLLGALYLFPNRLTMAGVARPRDSQIKILQCAAASPSACWLGPTWPPTATSLGAPRLADDWPPESTRPSSFRLPGCSQCSVCIASPGSFPAARTSSWNSERYARHFMGAVAACYQIESLRISPLEELRVVTCGKENIRFWRIKVRGKLHRTTCCLSLAGVLPGPPI